jgi:glycosyltransferase involved in cell wall biosynthesis
MNSLKKNPLISVIVPVYKVERYLNVCVDSIVNQTYANLEIILVDDGSPDKCPEICDEYARLDNRIKVIHQENGGLSAARNAGIDIASGEFLTFIDSDDFIAKKYVELLYKGIVEFDADISIASFCTFTKEDKLETQNDEIFFVEITREESFRRYGALNAELSMPFISACNKLYKKDFFASIRFPIGKLYEDAFTTYKLLDKAKKIVFTPTRLYFYRMNPQSILGQSFREKHLEMVEAFRSGFDFFDEKGKNEIASLFIPPMLMREIYCWWGVRFVLKNKKKAGDVLNDYRKNCRKLKCKKNVGLSWFIVFKVIAFFPWLYMIYRRVSPSYVGDR